MVVPPPQADFYIYSDFEPWPEHLRRLHLVTTTAAPAWLLLERYGAARPCPAARLASPAALRLRLVSPLQHGNTLQ